METNNYDPLHPLEHKYEDGNKTGSQSYTNLSCLSQLYWPTFQPKAFRDNVSGPIISSHGLSHMQTCSIPILLKPILYTLNY